MSDTRDLVGILAAWGIGDVWSAQVPATGTINRTLLVTTGTGKYAVRAYQHADRRRAEAEHAIIAYARAAGVPAVAPLPLPDGATILTREGRHYALFPWATGTQLARGELGEREGAAMGRALARLHRALGGYPRERVWQRDLRIDPARTLGAIDVMQALIQARPVLQESDTWALQRLAGQRAAVERADGARLVAFEILEQQAIHGDYQEANLFFAHGRVSAIIDWDQAYLAPRAWEVIRTLDLVFRFEPGPCHAFVHAYRRVLALPTEQLDIAAESYSLMRAHDLWMYHAIYQAGNERVRRFIEPGGFKAPIDGWLAARRAIRGHAAQA